MNKNILKAIPILQKHGFIKASLVGSYARGDFTEESDIDILVDSPKKMSLLGLIRAECELKDTIGKDVELLTYNSLHPYIREYILKDEKVLYG